MSRKRTMQGIQVLAAIEQGVFDAYKVTLSRARDKSVLRAQCRFYLAKDVKFMQIETRRRDGSVHHENVNFTDAPGKLQGLLMKEYSRMNIMTGDSMMQFMRNDNAVTLMTQSNAAPSSQHAGNDTPHDREKRYIIAQDEPFLRQLGIAGEDGVYKSHMDKYRQINRFAEHIAELAPALPKNAVVCDMCCGKGYLTFAAYVCLQRMGINVKMYGIDIKEKTVDACRAAADALGYDMQFMCADINKTPPPESDVVISLHACDTLTDVVLARAIKSRVKAIISSPCCHHELSTQVQNDDLSHILKYGALKQRFAEILTDAIRADTLKAFGYDVKIVEFIELEHTHKNLAYCAVLRGSQNPVLMDELRHKFALYNVNPCISRLLDM